MIDGPRPVVLVTGAAGYIGGHVVRALAESSDVRAQVRRPGDWLSGVDILNRPLDALGPAAFSGVDAVVHLAGADEVCFACDPARSYAETVDATALVLDQCRRAGIERVVYLSTVHVYGAALAPGSHITETTAPVPAAPYAEARLASERLVASLGESAVVLRLTNAVGPPLDPAVTRWTLVANDLCRQGATTGRLELKSAGTQWRDFIAMADVRRAVALACGTLEGGIYNLASGERCTILALAALVQDAFEAQTGRRPELHAPPSDAGPDEPYVVDNGRLRAAGWRPHHTVADAIASTAAACLEWRDRL